MYKNLNNLRELTIFDLCEDVTKIQEFIPTAGCSEFNMEEYRLFCRQNPTSNALHMTLLANVLGDRDLSTAIQQEFATELKAFFAEK